MSKKITKREFIKDLAIISGLSLYPSALNLFSSMKSADLWKWSREAMFYTKKEKSIYCDLCPNQCIIYEEKKGTCKNRIFTKNKLYTIAYGNPCAVHIDPIEKKPFYHFYATSKSFSIATAGCNFSCLNCQNWSISQFSPEETRNIDLMPEKVVENALNNGCKSIAYTYSEPVVFYEYMYDTAKLARKKGLKNVIVSNGYINEKPLKELCRYIDGATIDIKGFTEEVYKKLNGGSLLPVLNALKIYKEKGVWLEISNLIVPSWSDDTNMIKNMCKWLADNKFHDTPLHFLRFSPMYKLTNLPPTPLSTLLNARQIALDSGLKYVYIGNAPGSNAENTICPNCKKIVVERKGFYVINYQLDNGKCKFCGEKIAGVW